VATVNYATNISQRTPCVLVLDASASMETRVTGGSQRIDLLNAGIRSFYEALNEDEIALSRVQVAAVSVGGDTSDAELLMDWTDAADFRPFSLSAGHSTPLGAGVLLALEAIETQKLELRKFGISYTRPWIFILTDGEPTDHKETWDLASTRAREAEASQKVEIFPIGIGNIDLTKIQTLSDRRSPMTMEATHFRELFVWLSASLGQISRSVPGANVDLLPTDPWAAVKL
jgi:uncharacterized protein YegL